MYIILSRLFYTLFYYNSYVQITFLHIFMKYVMYVLNKMFLKMKERNFFKYKNINIFKYKYIQQ